jgi:hypothetical protein
LKNSFEFKKKVFEKYVFLKRKPLEFIWENNKISYPKK